MEKTRSKWLPAAVIAVLVLFLGIAVYAAVSLKQSKDELKVRVAELEAELAAVPDTETVMRESEGRLLGDGEMYYSRSSIAEEADMAESMTELMGHLFPDRNVYFNGERYSYDLLSDNIKKHDYDLDKILTVKETGRKVYTGTQEAVSLTGIDVSEWQDDIDWYKVKKSGIKFAFLRAGVRGYESGQIFEDETFRRNLRGAIMNQIPVGVYFYTQAATPQEGIQEAQMVLDLIKGYQVTWPIVVDVEREDSDTSRTKDLTPSQRTDIVIAFCETIEAAGYTPMIYGNIRMLCSDLEPERIAKYDKWLAQYFNRPTYRYDFGIWQYSSTAHVDGISGNVDINLAFRDYGKQD